MLAVRLELAGLHKKRNQGEPSHMIVGFEFDDAREVSGGLGKASTPGTKAATLGQ